MVDRQPLLAWYSALSADDQEAVSERVAIKIESMGINEWDALQQAQEERCERID